MNRKVYILIIVTLLQFSALSQPYTELSALKFQKYSSNENQTNEYSAAIFIPIKTKKNNYLIFGAGYNKLSLENSLNQPKISNLEALAIQLGRVINLNNDWNMTTILIEKISSDLIKVIDIFLMRNYENLSKVFLEDRFYSRLKQQRDTSHLLDNHHLLP